VLDARRRELNAQLAAAGKKVSYTHLIGYAIARAARELPVMTLPSKTSMGSRTASIRRR